MTFGLAMRWMALGVFVGLLGCGGRSLPTAKVSGKVSYKGMPLSAGTITFLPDSGRPGYGKIVNGEIKDVSTMSENDGAPLGPNTVTIQSVEESGKQDMYAVPKSLIPERYADPAKSGLTADIKAGGPNEFTFDLKE
jgi:hypothetical protein